MMNQPPKNKQIANHSFHECYLKIDILDMEDK